MTLIEENETIVPNLVEKLKSLGVENNSNTISILRTLTRLSSSPSCAIEITKSNCIGLCTKIMAAHKNSAAVSYGVNIIWNIMESPCSKIAAGILCESVLKIIF